MINSIKKTENNNDVSQILSVTSTRQRNYLKKISLSQLHKSTQKDSIKNRYNVDSIQPLSYKPKRLLKISCYDGKVPLRCLGKASLDLEKTICVTENKQNIQDTTKTEILNTERNFHPQIMSDYQFRSNYLYKYVLNLDNFNKLKKFTDIISDSSKSIFSTIFTQISELLEKQSKVAFDNKTNLNNGNLIENSVKFSESEKKLIRAFSEYSVLSNKILNVLFNELNEVKIDNKKLKRKTYEDDIYLKIKTQELDDLQKYLKDNDVSTKIFLKKSKEDKIKQLKVKYNHRENEYALLIYDLENEIRNLTKILDKNKEYFNKYKDTEKEVEDSKKQMEKNKFIFNKKIQEKKIECALEKDIQEDLKKKLNDLNKIIDEFKLEKENKKMEDREIQTLLKKLNMNIMEREENILMLNEELEWYILELNKERKSHQITKNDLDVLEKKIYDESKKVEEDIRSKNKMKFNSSENFNYSGISMSPKNEEETGRDSVYMKDVNVSPVPTNFTKDNNS